MRIIALTVSRSRVSLASRLATVPPKTPWTIVAKTAAACIRLIHQTGEKVQDRMNGS